MKIEINYIWVLNFTKNGVKTGLVLKNLIVSIKFFNSVTI